MLKQQEVNDYFFISLFSYVFAIAFLLVWIVPITYCIRHNNVLPGGDEYTCAPPLRPPEMLGFSAAFCVIAAISWHFFKRNMQNFINL